MGGFEHIDKNRRGQRKDDIEDVKIHAVTGPQDNVRACVVERSTSCLRGRHDEAEEAITGECPISVPYHICAIEGQALALR